MKNDSAVTDSHPQASQAAEAGEVGVEYNRRVGGWGFQIQHVGRPSHVGDLCQPLAMTFLNKEQVPWRWVFILQVRKVKPRDEG